MGRVVTVVDYGMGNLLSVRRALEHVGAEPHLTSDADEVGSAERLVIPGVGAFADGMRELHARGLVEPIRAAAKAERPILGICLGMHLLLEESEEFGRHGGIGLLPGRVVGLPREVEGRPNKVPHIGWSAIHPPAGAPESWWSDSPLEPVADGAEFYFVHSFVADPTHPRDCLAEVATNGYRFPAALGHGRITGTQFHPEKSGPTGLSLIRAFVEG